MNEKIHAALDGELAREALSPEEQERLRAAEATLRDSSDAIRAAPAPDLAARVMASLPAAYGLPQPRQHDLLVRAARWLWRPRPLSLLWRPLYLPAAVAVLLLVFLARPAPPPSGEPSAESAPAAVDMPRLYVQFRLEAPGASRVDLAGSFTGWAPAVELVEAGPGVWSALVPLEPGVYDYTFVVDGERWVIDPYAPQVGDGFGGSNNRLFLTNPAGNV